MNGANMNGVNMNEANMNEADIRGAYMDNGTDIDFSCWPLWRGSLGVHVGTRQWYQLAYHLCALIIDDPACIEARNALLPLANKFHRAEERGVLQPIGRGNA